MMWKGLASWMTALVVVAAIGSQAAADQGDCGQPASSGPEPVATDCLYILNVAVGLLTCSPECACAPKGSLPISATDALTCLASVVGGSVAPDCPCDTTTTSTIATTTSSTTSTSTTTEYNPTTTSTTTTLPDPCDPNPCQNGGECTPLGGGDFACFCFPEWTGPTCEECGTQCSEDAAYFRDRFLTCVVDTEFCDRPYATCPEFCAGWMGCAGELFIDETYGTVVGVVECF
jgi:hypothetical protein